MSARTEPAVRAAAITPADAGEHKYRSLYIGSTGDVKVDTEGGDAITFTNVPVGFFPVAVTRVYATGTTADEIIGLN